MEPPNRSQDRSTNYKIHNFFSSVTSHPLFSIIITTSLLAFLYIPRPLLPFLISPSFLSSLLFLFSLFRFGTSSSPDSQTNPKPDNKDSPTELYVPETRSALSSTSWSSIQDQHCLDFAGPLEVIYEDYEGEEEDEIGSLHEYAKWLREDKNGHDDDDEDDDDDDDEDDDDDDDEEDDDEIEEELIELSFEDEDNLIEIDISRFQSEY